LNHRQNSKSPKLGSLAELQFLEAFFEATKPLDLTCALTHRQKAPLVFRENRFLVLYKVVFSRISPTRLSNEIFAVFKLPARQIIFRFPCVSAFVPTIARMCSAAAVGAGRKLSHQTEKYGGKFKNCKDFIGHFLGIFC
jgi:hypothetical protein